MSTCTRSARSSRTKPRTAGSWSGSRTTPAAARCGSSSGSAGARSRRGATGCEPMSLSSADQFLRRRVVFALLAAARLLRRALTTSERTYRLLFLPGLEGVRWRFGKWRAWRAYEDARRSVPAYRDFVAAHGTPKVRARGFDPDLTAIPVTDKDSYVR